MLEQNIDTRWSGLQLDIALRAQACLNLQCLPTVSQVSRASDHIPDGPRLGGGGDGGIYVFLSPLQTAPGNMKQAGVFFLLLWCASILKISNKTSSHSINQATVP